MSAAAHGTSDAPNYSCPLCHEPSGMVLNAAQAFCTGGDDCSVVMFDPSSPSGGLANPQFMDLTGNCPAPAERSALPGELCTCGRQAVRVYTSRPGDPVGHCGFNNGGAPADGWCPFCNNELRHDGHGWNEAAQTSSVLSQGERCPRYRLRLDSA